VEAVWKYIKLKGRVLYWFAIVKMAWKYYEKQSQFPPVFAAA